MKKVLVIQNKRIGDVLVASVIAQNIKKVYPQCTVDFFVYDYTTGVIENHPSIDNIIPIKEKELKKIATLFSWIRKIRTEKYDIIFDPYAKLQSKIIALFSGVPIRIGLVKPNKKLPLKFYTSIVRSLDKKTHICGKAIEDRVNMVSSVFKLKKENTDFVPKLFLSPKEKKYHKLEDYKKPCIVLGVLGSTPIKSMPYEYVVQLTNFITENYDVNIIFNYAPHQKDEALKIYNECNRKERILIDLYEDSIRGFITLMNQCSLLISNEGGSVHIAKALDKPTFTIFSPYILKEHWASFEDGIKHTSVHLLEEKPELYKNTTASTLKNIESDPFEMYRELTPELIIPKLNAFLSEHLGNFEYM